MMVIRTTVVIIIIIIIIIILYSKTYIINIYHSRIVNMPLFLFQEMIYISF